MTAEKLRVVYILAASHSGSTLLSMLLNSHPEVCTVGELKITSLGNVDAYRCSCLARVRECPFWSGIKEDMAKRGIPFDIANPGTDLRSRASPYIYRLLRPLHRGPVLEWIRDLLLALSPSWRVHRQRIQSINGNLMSCVLARSGKRVIVDSSKDGIRLKYLLRDPALDVRVVRLVRDGRAVTLTYIDPGQFADASDPRLRGGGTGTDRRGERLATEAATHQWRRSNEEAETLIAQIEPERWTEVRYEALCAQPEAMLRQLFAFIGVDPDRPRPEFRAVAHHVIGNGMRLDSTSEIRLDDRWRTALADADLAKFDAIGGNMNRLLGYS